MVERTRLLSAAESVARVSGITDGVRVVYDEHSGSIVVRDVETLTVLMHVKFMAHWNQLSAEKKTALLKAIGELLLAGGS